MKNIQAQIARSADAQTEFIPVLEENTVIGGNVVCTGVTLDEISTVDIYSGATKIGTATFPDNSAAGTVAEIVMSATLATRKTQVSPAVPLKIVTGGEQTTVSGFNVVLQLDETCAPRD